jgi:glycerol-3-phosphate dehydrogenase
MVVVVGGGATGLGVAWDLLLRGIPVTVVEQHDLGAGTSGRFHGLLHSGGRYVVSDPPSAKACYEENQILRRILPGAVEDTGGVFVAMPDETARTFEPQWLKGCERAGIPVEPIAPGALAEELPELTRAVWSAYRVPDAVLEGFSVLFRLAYHIERLGGHILTQSQLVDVQLQNGRVSGVTVRAADGRPQSMAADVVVNAAGPWAGEVSRIFGDPLAMQLAGGMMMVFANRMVNQVVNRLAPPGDGDILVPHGHTVIWGTTDVPQRDPDPPEPRREEALALLKLGQELFPRMSDWRVLRAFTGVRPLYQPEADDKPSRAITRDYTLIDHRRRAGYRGAFSIVGGKWTTFRLMAERVGDEVAQYLGIQVASRTRDTVLEPEEGPRSDGPVVCECEQVSVGQLERYLDYPLNALRPRSWFAMGPCQGTFCGHRVLALRARHTHQVAIDELRALRQERLKGMEPVGWGDNARQLALMQAIRLQTLAEEDAP